MAETLDGSDRELRVNEVLAAYYEAMDAGQPIDPREFLARHADLADDLSSFFAAKQEFEQNASPLLAEDRTTPRGSTDPGVYTIGDYEVQEEIGRGGMGVVYRARHRDLGRLVALKMILAGDQADGGDRKRFRTEAEAIARLQHPNIVQVHEVGEHDGKPFFSLEFCTGGSLDRQLDGTPWFAAEAARLVQTLARAMYHAHQQGVVHRDLKPANVLLAPKFETRNPQSAIRNPQSGPTGSEFEFRISDFEPKVTDFGLAKQLDRAGQTTPGAILGTPSYMAPEQAGGPGRQIGPACDVYALGAILYELLTGRPPFKAATPLETILQVVRDEPVPLRQLQTKLPVDLETICLRCLQKEPSRRYESATALADDLGRFLEGRPIVARPGGQLERAAKWVRRNPLLAGLAGLLLAVLLAGTAVSTYLGLDAADQAREAIAKGNELASTNETLTRTAEDLGRSREELKRNADQLEGTLARSLLRPLALHPGQPMSEPEWEALWELAQNRRRGLGLRFVAEASRTPAGSRQLRDRAALALHAAVGLDERARADVEKLLLAQLDDVMLGEEHRRDLALALSAWDGLSSFAAVRTANVLLAAMTNPRSHALGSLAEGLSLLGPRLGARDAAQVALAIVGLVKESRNPATGQALIPVLSALAPRLGARETTAVAGILLQACKEAREPAFLEQLVKGVLVLAGRMEAREAGQAVRTLVPLLTDATAPSTMEQLANALGELAPRLEASTAAATAQALVEAIKETSDPKLLGRLAQVLGVLAGRLETREATRTATAIVELFKEPKNPDALVMLAPVLALLAPRMDTREAVRAHGTLLELFKEARHPASLLQGLGQSLSALAARLESKEAAQTVDALLGAIKDGKQTVYPLALCLPALAARLAPGDAARAVTGLLQAIKDVKELTTLSALEQALSAGASRLDAQQAARAAQAVVQTIKETTDFNSLYPLYHGLSALAPRLECREAAAVAIDLVQLIPTRNPMAMQRWADALSALAPWMEAKETAPIAQALVQAVKDARAPETVHFPARILCAMAAHLDAGTAALAVFSLLQAVKETRAYVSPEWGWNLSALGARLEAREAVQAMTTITLLLRQTNVAPDTMKNLAPLLSSLAARLETRDAAQAALLLTKAVKDVKEAHGLSALGQGLSALADRMEVQDAARTARILTRASQEATFARELPPLCQGLSALGARLQDREAAAVGNHLVGLLRDARDSNVQRCLAQGLSVLAARMETGLTAPAAILLVEIMKDVTQPDLQQQLASSLSALLSHVPPAEVPTRTRVLASAVVHPAVAGNALTGFALLLQAAEPSPCLLSVQQLIDILKMPTCTGAARRVILDQLGSHYRRPFADLWDFVRFAREQDAKMDLTNPPVPPELPRPQLPRPEQPRFGMVS
jgi:hypothetical protein